MDINRSIIKKNFVTTKINIYIYILAGYARYKWKHCIDFMSCDTIDDIKINRNIRTSIIFRTICHVYLSENLIKSML